MSTPATTAYHVTPPEGYTSVENLWPEGKVPGATGTTPDDTPRLYSYPAKGPGPHAAVVVIPGGGYKHLVTGREGEVEAKWLNERGISAYVLVYRLTPNYFYPWPIADGQRAMRFVRSHAEQWHLRPDAIGTWGFSAGGHLVGMLAVLAPHSDVRVESGQPAGAQDAIDAVSSRPDFTIIGYGRLTTDKNVSGRFSLDTLLGPNPHKDWDHAIDVASNVSDTTSPSFLYANEMDEVVGSLNATRYFEAMQHHKVPCELHIFEQGPHGTGMAQNLPKYPELAIWPTLLENWLRVRGVLPATQYKE